MFKSFFSRWSPCAKRSTKNQEPSYRDQPQSTYLHPLEEVSSYHLTFETPSTETSFTFKVDPVRLNKVPLRYLGTAECILRGILAENEKDSQGNLIAFQGNFEDFSHRGDKEEKYLASQVHGLVGVIHTAFQSHYALSLSVSDFIILIGQGLGAHINANAEKLRKNFVGHEGKKTIEVRRDEFVLGEQNDWSTVFGEFGEKIKRKVKADVYGVIIDDTSVATVTSRIVSEITLMEAMKSYFTYRLKSNCGIPEITLEGTPEDWQKLKDKVRKLVEMNKDDCLGLKYWLDQLVPVVEKICEAGIERRVDREFWGNIYKYHRMSGGDKITGWITRFFPSLASISMDRVSFAGGITSEMIPKQVCEVPFIWEYFYQDIPMKFTAGFLGAEFNKDLCQVKSAHFWCVTQSEERKQESRN